MLLVRVNLVVSTIVNLVSSIAQLVGAVILVVTPLRVRHGDTDAVQTLRWNTQLFTTQMSNDTSSECVTQDIDRGTDSISIIEKIVQYYNWDNCC